MEQLSFLEKLGVFWQNILAHPIFICLLLLPALIIFLNKKITKKAIIILYILVLAVVLFVGNSTIFKLFDNMIDGLFMTLYFPNFITLFIVEVLSAIIAFVTFIKKDINKLNKIINIVGFILIQTLFCLVITVVNANDIDIYKENALYASNDVLTLMQLLMGTFALQVISIIVIFAIEKITAKLDGKEATINQNKQTLKLEKVKIITPNLVKEPEVKLEKPKPLDKSLIEEAKIAPLDINEEIAKDTAKKLIEEQQRQMKEYEEKKKQEEEQRQKQAQILEAEKAQKAEEERKQKEELERLRKENDLKIKPLDKTLIGEEQIAPLDLNEEIAKDNAKKLIEEEQRQRKEIEEKKKQEEEQRQKQAQILEAEKAQKAEEERKQKEELERLRKENDLKIKPLDKTLIGEEPIAPFDLNAEIKKEEEQKQAAINAEIKQKQEEYNKAKESNFSFDNFKMEYPEAKTKTTEIPIPDLEMLNQPIINLKPEIKQPETTEQTPIPNLEIPKETIINSKPEINQTETTKPQEEPIKDINEEQELIANLNIVNFDKMIKAVRNLKRVYTL